MHSSRRVAPGTMPVQPPQRRPAARRFGAGVLVAGLAALGALAIYRLIEKPRRTVPHQEEEPPHISAARRLNGAAAMLSFSVVADSAMEHYRGAFHNPAMYLAPTVSAITLANSLHMTATPAHFGAGRTMLAGLALATGLGGFGFHAYNLTKREGGFDLANLFYGAPLGAPFALTLAGLAGLGASRLVLEGERREPGRLLGRPAGPVLARATAAGPDRHDRGSGIAAFPRRVPRSLYVCAGDPAAIDRIALGARRKQPQSDRRGRTNAASDCGNGHCR